MITILTRLFPQDISEYIYHLLIKDHINTILIGKLYLNSLIMEKHNTKFNKLNIINNPILCYDPKFEYFKLINVCEFLKHTKIHFIDKKLYTYDDETKEIINNFLNFIGFVSDLNDAYYYKPVKEKMKLLIKELKN